MHSCPRISCPWICAAALLLLAPVHVVNAQQYQFEVIHAFSTAGPGGSGPAGRLLEAPDGSLYGTTQAGGAGNAGVVFRISPDRGSVVTTDLLGNTTGRTPWAGLTQTPDGTLYGATRSGGANNTGAFFSISPSGTFTTYDLPTVPSTTCGNPPPPADGPVAPLVLAPDGNLYGSVTGYPAYNFCPDYEGSVVRLTPQGGLTQFPVPGGVGLVGPLLVAANGLLYGLADAKNCGGGRCSGGQAFTLDSAGGISVLHTFSPNEGVAPKALVLGPDGNFYGSASQGGRLGLGTVFRMSASGAVTVLHSFAFGAFPSPLTLGSDGFLYGVTMNGGPPGLNPIASGTVFRIDTAGNIAYIHTFFTNDEVGLAPLGSLMQSKDGSLYGTTSQGGTGGGGVVFRIKSTTPRPQIAIELAAATSLNPVTIRGWAIDHGAFTGTGIDTVHVYAFPNPGSDAAPIFVGVSSDGSNRPDVAASFGVQFANSGYQLTTTLSPGTYLIAAFAHSTVTDTFAAVATRTLTVVEPQSLPAMSLDLLASGASVTGPFQIAGWAIDRGAPAGTGVDAIHVWAVPTNGGAPVFAGVALYGFSRSDIRSIFGAQFEASGYWLTVSLPPGTYAIAAFAYSTVTNTFNNVRTVSNVVVR